MQKKIKKRSENAKKAKKMQKMQKNVKNAKMQNPFLFFSNDFFSHRMSIEPELSFNYTKHELHA